MFFGEDRIAAVREMILADRRGRPQEGAREARAVPEGRLRRHLRGDGRPAGHDPPARPAAARVPAAEGQRPAPRKSPSSSASTVDEDLRARRRAARVQPDDGLPRLPAADRLPRDRRHAGAGDHRGGHRGEEEGQERAAGDHDPARRRGRGTDAAQEAGHRGRRGVHEEGRREGRVPDRHDDRAAAGVPRRRTRSPRRPSSSASAPTT